MHFGCLKDCASRGGKPSKTLSHAQLTYGAGIVASFTNLFEGTRVVPKLIEIHLVAKDAKPFFPELEFGLKELEFRAVHHDSHIKKFFSFHVWYYPNNSVFKQVILWHRTLLL
jgi:hypothetical protein